MCIKYSGIKTGSKVYDPFIGTGTTIISAIKHNMYAIGTDIDSDYLTFSKHRIDSMIKSNTNTISETISDDESLFEFE
jgi:tRNA G10  N-methylase Trm11